MRYGWLWLQEPNYSLLLNSCGLCPTIHVKIFASNNFHGFRECAPFANICYECYTGCTMSDVIRKMVDNSSLQCCVTKQRNNRVVIHKTSKRLAYFLYWCGTGSARCMRCRIFKLISLRSLSRPRRSPLLVFQIPVNHFQEMYHLHPSVKWTKKLNLVWRDSNSLKEVHTERRPEPQGSKVCFDPRYCCSHPYVHGWSSTYNESIPNFTEVTSVHWAKAFRHSCCFWQSSLYKTSTPDK